MKRYMGRHGILLVRPVQWFRHRGVYTGLPFLTLGRSIGLHFDHSSLAIGVSWGGLRGVCIDVLFWTLRFKHGGYMK